MRILNLYAGLGGNRKLWPAATKRRFYEIVYTLQLGNTFTIVAVASC